MQFKAIGIVLGFAIEKFMISVFNALFFAAGAPPPAEQDIDFFDSVRL